MPDITTAAQLSYTEGAFRSFRVAPARLTYTAGNVVSSKDTTLSTAAEIPQLDRLNRIVDKASGETEQQFQRRQLIWQQTMEAIESAFEAVNARVDEVAILARLSAVEQVAEVANDNAVAAQSTAAQVQEATKQTFIAVDPVYEDIFNENFDKIP